MACCHGWKKPAATPTAAQLNSLAWVRDNELINQNNYLKNVITKDDWTWHSVGHPVLGRAAHRATHHGDQRFLGVGRRLRQHE